MRERPAGRECGWLCGCPGPFRIRWARPPGTRRCNRHRMCIEFLLHSGLFCECGL